MHLCGYTPVPPDVILPDGVGNFQQLIHAVACSMVFITGQCRRTRVISTGMVSLPASSAAVPDVGWRVLHHHVVARLRQQ